MVSGQLLASCRSSSSKNQQIWYIIWRWIRLWRHKTDIYKIEKNSSIDISVFGYANKIKILKCLVRDCFKINGKQMIKMSKKGE